jgi:hypothetical protein
VSIHSLPGISHCISIQGAAAAEVEVEAERSIRTMAAGMYSTTGCVVFGDFVILGWLFRTLQPT